MQHSTRYSTASRFLSLFLVAAAFVLIAILAAPLRAQSLPSQPLSSPENSLVQTHVWHGTVGAQHARLLRSRHAAVRGKAMQNLIILATQRPGRFDLEPAVPVLLNIYAQDANESQRIMAAATLSAIGDWYGIEELDRLCALEHRSSWEYRVGRDAVVYYYVTQRMNHETERAAYHLTKGHMKRAERHARRAAFYRSKLG